MMIAITGFANAQIRVGGNIYGGGNQGNIGGSTKVTIQAGDIGYTEEPIENRPLQSPRGKVFGGSRMSNVGGNTFVHIDGKNATGYIIANYVFGGNDIAGQIGTAKAVGETTPSELTEILTIPEPTESEISAAGSREQYIKNYKAAHPRKNAIDDTWNSYVRVSAKLESSAELFTQSEIDAAGSSDPAYGKTTNDVKTKAVPATDAEKIYIGQLFGGGNGAYEFEEVGSKAAPAVTTYNIYALPRTAGDQPIATNTTGFTRPEIDKTYLEVIGGSIVYAYGGGNNATVREKTVIHVDNPTKVVNHILVNTTTGEEAESSVYETYEASNPLTVPTGYTEKLSTERFKEMGINTGFSKPSSAEFQIGRFFGGNNQAEMAIMPTWNLLDGKIRRLYSGGNKGAMTCPMGLLLEIPEYSNLTADYVFGGCRMADVIPTRNGSYKPVMNLTSENYPDADLLHDYNFPNELAARTLIRGGYINNVFGGNDITGKVFGGNAVGIYTSVSGDVYGGGNGAYPYTDNAEAYENDDVYGDLCYSPQGSTIDALNAFRPNAEQVSIRIAGKDARHPTVIKGSLFVGGNCASLATVKTQPMVELKFGSYAIANNVFLGNNGEDMVNKDYLKLYADDNFNSIRLTNPRAMARYMEGVAMTLQPDVVFDALDNKDPADYQPYSSYVGSFFCGGNVGSMAIKGKNKYRIDNKLNIFEKFVGGCNNADVPVIYDDGTTPLNAPFEGGVLGSLDERYANGNIVNGSEIYFTEGGAADAKIKDRLEINLENMTITPLRWDPTGTMLIWNTQRWEDEVYEMLEAGTELEKGDKYYTLSYSGNTVPEGGLTVTGYDDYYSRSGEDPSYVYTKISHGTVLAAGTMYYTKVYSEPITVTADGGYIIVKASDEYYEKTGGFVDVPNIPYWDKEAGQMVSGYNHKDYEDIRLLGGNVYGGCYNSGHINGNVTININQDELKRDEVFDFGDGPYGRKASGVKFLDQRDDLDAMALMVFGAGYGKDTEVWGSSTVNLNQGYAFQVLGGGEMGIVGRPIGTSDKKDGTYDASTKEYTTNGKLYKYDSRYSSTVNLNGTPTATDNETHVPDMAETEYIYGAGKEGEVCGNSYVYLGAGRIYDAFAGACDANILGHTEAYIGRQSNGDGTLKDGFPWIQDIVYGGNDFGGNIYGNYDDDYDFTKRLREYEHDVTMIQGYEAGKVPEVMKSASYVEFYQGRVDTIFGGNYAYYDYAKDYPGYKMPYLASSFVNIRPITNDRNAIQAVFGGGTGFPKNRDGDNSQDHSYVLIDIPDGETNYANTEIFGAGSYNGLGMRYPKLTTFAKTFNRDLCSAVIDLLHGEVSSAYGGSFNEGVTARTVVNVPAESTIKIKNIFGGAYGTQILPPCDVIQAIVNYKNTSGNALVTGAIYGGNNNERRSVFTQVNISSPVWSNKEKGYLTTVYGAGKGIDTWSEHTQVNLLNGAKVYEVYGGGEMGHVLNTESVQKYMQLYKEKPSDQISKQDPKWSDPARWNGEVGKGTIKTTKLKEDDEKTIKEEWDDDWQDAWKLGNYYTPNANFDDYFDTFAALRSTSLVRIAEIDDRDFSAFSEQEKQKRKFIYSTNVIINEGAEVVNYAYGGGYGDSSDDLTGDVYGNTYIALLGGKVKKDIYAACTAGDVRDVFGVGAYYYNTEDPTDEKNNKFGFTASATAYIRGGTCRNVYGGGWEGQVGKHTKYVDGHLVEASITDSPDDDIPGETHVVIGTLSTTPTFTDGLPAIQRNAYGGGEGGGVYGTTHLTLNNGYIGYVHLNADEKQNERGEIVDATGEGLKARFEEKIVDETWKSQETGEYIPNTNLYEAGCLFGGGYVDNSQVDKAKVTIYGGQVRNSVFGGGEVAAIGRGTISVSTSGGKTVRTLTGLYRPGRTNIDMYGGHVQRNVYGGGRGYDNLGGHGKLKLNTDGCIFGQTEVHIHGGEIGTSDGLANGDGNVFGGCDIGFVYSAYENPDGTFGRGVKTGVRYDGGYHGSYFKHAWDNGGKDEQDETLFAHDPKKPEERQFTEDCKVLIEPHCQLLHTYKVPVLDSDNNPVINEQGEIETTTHIGESTTIGSKTYSPGEYVSIDDLNKLKDKNTDADKWNRLDPTGIIIHNAVFAGGNTPPGSSTNNANTASVLGNATATINDVFHHDMITLGTGHTGGLYGDGNLTLVDGYRELNVTNYGTDYYSIAKEITIKQYRAMHDREAAYYELKYTCLKQCQDRNGTQYLPALGGSKAATITADDMLELFLEYDETLKKYVSVKDGDNDILVWDAKDKEWKPNTAAGTNYWVESGVLPVYAGRLMNSLQRADFCGVWGSRMVMRGAKDRVPDVADNTNYTINRVREVSLNKKESVIAADKEIPSSSDEYYRQRVHGNYFGIYSVVNYLGALTSDVDFGDENANTQTDGEWKYEIRTTDNTDSKYKADIQIAGQSDIGYGSENATFYNWKKGFHNDKRRNNGNSHNKVALASGVYLEITTEQSTGTDLYEKDWGPITGVIELDLINVSTGIGGGFVYAKNIHGTRQKTGLKNTTLTALNSGAVTQWDYKYIDQTTDATPVNKQVEWESSGNFVHSTQTIIDDCYNISGRYKLGNAVPAHYWYIKGSVYVYDQYITAYTGSPNAFSESADIPLTIAAASHGKIKLLNVMPNLYAYYASPGTPLNDGQKMIINEKTYYKNDPISYWDWYLLSNYEKQLFIEKTYVNCVSVNVDNEMEDGKLKIYEPGTLIMNENEFNTYGTHTYKDAEGNVIQTADKTVAGKDYIFRLSNNVSHDTGYLLTYKVNNPSIWDTWYTPKAYTETETKKIDNATYDALPAANKEKYEDGPTYRLKASLGGAVLGQREYNNGDLISKDIYDTYTHNINEDVNNNGALDTGEDLNNNEQLDTKITSSNGKQATFDEAYILTGNATITVTTETGTVERHLYPGATVPKAQTTDPALSGKVARAYICTSTIQLAKDEYIYRDSKMPQSQADGYVNSVITEIRKILPEGTISNARLAEIRRIDDLTNTEQTSLALTADQKKTLKPLLALRNDLTDYLVPAYYCTDDGKYGGNYYESGHNYRGLEAWSSMSADDRNYFEFNYDALDLLIDPYYSYQINENGTKTLLYPEGEKYQYDSAEGTLSAAQNNLTTLYTTKDLDVIAGTKAVGDVKQTSGYSTETAVNYTAIYNGDSPSATLPANVHVMHQGDNTPASVNQFVKGDTLSRETFESLANEQRHYAMIAAKDGRKETVGTDQKVTIYVVSASFQIGSTPYAIGETISGSTFDGLPESEQKNSITKVELLNPGDNDVYYFCREPYKITENHPVKDIDGDEYAQGATVPLGAVIPKATAGGFTGYDDLTNYQQNFSFQGISPTETSTLYVSRESNIYDLSKDKIITVIYQYDYEEADDKGNVNPISERHVLNIHLLFQSGIPTVENITKPEIILPGDYITIREPNVTPGAYEVTGGGWELFETLSDAESHINGQDYNPTYNPLYWYQHDWYVAYYAKSYLGRTYSNAVPVSVANYHDLAEVMSDVNKEHHMYIDHEDVLRDPKIYINDYSGIGKNGLDLFKDLFDLSLVTNSGGGYTVSGGKITEAESPANTNLTGHALLSNQVRAGRNLEFFMRTDIKHTGEWTPIGYDNVCDDPSTPSVDEGAAGKCFDGIFHGDGHTIRGLNSSLFNHLCGEVYNLGVTGSFTGGGIAETGSGYVENCWINTTATPDASKRAVFGNPSAGSNVKQLVNSYYQTGKAYSTTDTDNHGLAIAKPDKAFYNGEVAYDLNGFYLYKRYNDAKTTSGVEYSYYKPDVIDSETGNLVPQTGKYASNSQYCSSGYVPSSAPTGYIAPMYVENRFMDGDFRYAAGTIPSARNERRYERTVTTGSVTTTVPEFYPIWPDDYIFFGQKLTYGWAAEAHQDVPTAVARTDGRLAQNTSANRVYRAPAYYRNSTMSVAHFNPNAYLAAKEQLTAEQIEANATPREAYPNMTAIDFAGHNDAAYALAEKDGKWFYPPLLDDDGLLSISNCDETDNLLAYAPAESAESAESGYANKKTHNVLNSYFVEPVYDDYFDGSGSEHNKYTDGKLYNRVADATTSVIHGHVVQNDLLAINDHLLVDKQDFNAPIAYDFDSDHRMWYQRIPSSGEYVEHTSGWQAISLPFTAQMVSTHQKGEITHFYNGSETSKNGTGKKIGHEYWLRGLKDGSTMTLKSGETNILEAEFNYPGSPGDVSAHLDRKTDSNYFLWDYYYNNPDVHNHKDRNLDEYQEYYRSDRRYENYRMLTAATPYILGLPGQLYYEFDLSGTFEPANTATYKDHLPARLNKQVISFVSDKGIRINKSDKDMENEKTVTYGGYSYHFKPSYLNEDLTAGTYSYTLNKHIDANPSAVPPTAEVKAGSRFDKVPATGAATRVSAFRPYFTSNVTSSAKKMIPEHITFGSSDGEEGPETALDGDLEIFARGRTIYTRSHLKEPVVIRIINVGGATLRSYVLEPEQTIETPIHVAGAYLVNRKKLFIR